MRTRAAYFLLLRPDFFSDRAGFFADFFVERLAGFAAFFGERVFLAVFFFAAYLAPRTTAACVVRNSSPRAALIGEAAGNIRSEITALASRPSNPFNHAALARPPLSQPRHRTNRAH